MAFLDKIITRTGLKKYHQNMIEPMDNKLEVASQAIVALNDSIPGLQNNLTTTEAGYALDARQGKELNSKVEWVRNDIAPYEERVNVTPIEVSDNDTMYLVSMSTENDYAVNDYFFHQYNGCKLYKVIAPISKGTNIVVGTDVVEVTVTDEIKNLEAVTGIKGNNETDYRIGNVNLTPANIGAVNKAGDTMSGTLSIDAQNGVAGTTSYTYMVLGNNIPTANEKNSCGRLRLFSPSQYRTDIIPLSLTADRIIRLPDQDGTLIVTNSKTTTLGGQDTDTFTYTDVNIRKDGNVVSIHIGFTIKGSLSTNTVYDFGQLPVNFRPLIKWVVMPECSNYKMSEDAVMWINSSGVMKLYNATARNSGSRFVSGCFVANWN